MKNLSPRTKVKTSRRKMARRTRISKRKIGVTRAKERVLPLNKAKNSLTTGYFICNGPHRAKDCPKPEKLNAMVVAYERVQFDEGVPKRVNPL